MGRISHRPAYAASPKPPTTDSSRNADRTRSTSTPRCSARPAATPPSQRSSVLRYALGGRDRPASAGTAAGGAGSRAGFTMPQSSHSAAARTMSDDPERTLVATPAPGVRTRGLPDGGCARAETRIVDMTETQNPPPGPPPGPRVGVDREHLRSYERLTRSTTDRKVAGVAGGLGRHLNVDPTVLRVLFVVLCFFGGAGFLLYGAAWLLVPEDGATEGKIATSPATRNGLLIAAGVVAMLILLGQQLARRRLPVAGADRGHRRAGLGAGARPAAVGLGRVAGRRTRRCRARPPRSRLPDRARGSRPRRPRARAAAAATSPAAVAGDPAAGAGVPAAVPQARTAAVRADARAGRGRPRAHWVSTTPRGGTVVDTAYPALALAVVGAMLVVGAFVGRAGGLILLGLRRGLHPRGDLRGRRLPRPRLPRRPADLGRPRDRRPGALDVRSPPAARSST